MSASTTEIRAIPARLPADDRREQIMRVAKELFARYGFEGTTTSRIAKHARVNEAVLFRHFRSKEDLYWAMIDQQCEIRCGCQLLEVLLNSGASDHEIFAGIAQDILTCRASDHGLDRLLLFSSLENQRRSQGFFQACVAEYYERVAEYIQRRIAEGMFRPIEPRLAARGFVGMVMYHSLIQNLFGAKAFQDFDTQKVSEMLADIWLCGMEVRPAQSVQAKRTPRQTQRTQP